MGFFDKLKGSEQPTKIKELKPKGKRGAGPKKAVIQEEEYEEPKETKKLLKSEVGQLAIDLYETNENFVIQSTIAGVKPENLDITIENDMVTIGGERQKTTTSEEPGKFYYQECYWGSFSRQVILPEEVDGSKAEAKIKEGVLTLTIPKLKTVKKKKISVQQDE